jgi:hypothetical protein
MSAASVCSAHCRREVGEVGKQPLGTTKSVEAQRTRHRPGRPNAYNDGDDLRQRRHKHRSLRCGLQEDDDHAEQKDRVDHAEAVSGEPSVLALTDTHEQLGPKGATLRRIVLQPTFE